MQTEQIILKPLITEKSTKLRDLTNRYLFQVLPKANKYQIKLAVEKLYNVKVLNVKTNIKPGKLKRTGKSVKKTAKVKKAYIQLDKGQKIELFKSV
jgi:large subunit ribosomal protein L23